MFIKRCSDLFLKAKLFSSSTRKNDPFLNQKIFHQYWHKIAEILCFIKEHIFPFKCSVLKKPNWIHIKKEFFFLKSRISGLWVVGFFLPVIMNKLINYIN